MNAKRERRKLWLAILASLLVHVVVALSLAAFNGLSSPIPPPDEKAIELTMMDLSATPVPAFRVNPPHTETDPADESVEQPKEKTFESNANSLASSTLPATGEAPLPSQEGKDRPFVHLQTQDVSLATQGSQARPEPVATPAPSVAPSVAPTPKAETSPPPTATPPPTPVPTPEPIATPAQEQLAMLTSTPPPALRNPEEVEPTPPPEVGASTPPVTARPRPETPAASYQAQKQETRISGRITNRGARSSVDTVGTPLGKYRKQVQDAIGSRWYYYIKAKGDLANIGTAQIEAEVDSDGRIKNLRVRSNSSNEAFANICLQSFQEAQIPPIPPDLIPTLPGGRLPLDFSFTYFSN